MSTLRFLAVWSRAVIAPAWRRAAGVWIGAGIGGGVVFGPTGMQPHDLTRLALGVPAVGAVLAVTWMLVFVPTARVLVRADSATFLRSLPGPRWQPAVLAGVALVALQLPWLALWVRGDGVRGLAIVVGLSGLIAAIATWRPRVRRVRAPRWKTAQAALRGVYVRALRRRASDALVRGVGLAILAGLVAALVVRNNALAGSGAAALGTGVIAIVLIPGWVGALLPLVEAQRTCDWLASSLGISAVARMVVLATMVAVVYVAGTLVALVAAAVAFAALFGTASADTIAWFSSVALASALGIALLATRALLGAERDGSRDRHDATGDRDGTEADRNAIDGTRDVSGAASRVVVGEIGASAAAVLCVGWLGVAGVGVLVAAGACALLTARVA